MSISPVDGLGSSPKRSSTNPWLPLKSRDEFRLLSILPGAFDDPIKCTLAIASLSSSPEYEAVSYCWGDPDAPREFILIYNFQAPVTVNLHDALKRIRHQDRERVVWIDQLSINQWDLEERAEQVAQMRSIYKSCTKGLLWLGELPSDADFAEGDVVNFLESCRYLAQRGRYPESSIALLLQDNLAGETARRAMTAMVGPSNQWWYRSWTVQEAILPPRAVVMWGPLTIDMSILEEAAVRFSYPTLFPSALENRVRDLNLGTKTFTRVIHGLRTTREGEGSLYILHRWRYRHATDPLDKVYAIAGLLTNPLPCLQKCSYTISPAELYANLTIDLIRDMDNLAPLVTTGHEPHVTPGLPTWAIDMISCPAENSQPVDLFQHLSRNLYFRAMGDRVVHMETSHDNKTISLAGALVDTVAFVAPALGAEVWDHGERSQNVFAHARYWNSLLHSWRQQTGATGADYIGGGSLDDAFALTMFSTQRHRTSPSKEKIENLRVVLATGEYLYYEDPLSIVVLGKAFFVTGKGYIGIGPPHTAVDDQVWVLFGGFLPFVLSPRGYNYACVGSAYVHGIMDGEFIKDLKPEQESKVNLI